MTSAKWYNRKPQTLFPHGNTNSIIHGSIPSEGNSEARSSYTPGKCKPVTQKSAGKFVALLFQNSFPGRVQLIRRKLPTPSFSLEWEREDWNICLAFRLFKGLSKGLVYVLPTSKC